LQKVNCIMVIALLKAVVFQWIWWHLDRGFADFYLEAIDSWTKSRSLLGNCSLCPAGNSLIQERASKSNRLAATVLWKLRRRKRRTHIRQTSSTIRSIQYFGFELEYIRYNSSVPVSIRILVPSTINSIESDKGHICENSAAEMENPQYDADLIWLLEDTIESDSASHQCHLTMRQI
jgi:hypothetical protein